MQRQSAPAALMPFLYDYLLCGVRARLGPGLLLPHTARGPLPRKRRRPDPTTERRG